MGKTLVSCPHWYSSRHRPGLSVRMTLSLNTFIAILKNANQMVRNFVQKASGGGNLNYRPTTTVLIVGV